MHDLGAPDTISRARTPSCTPRRSPPPPSGRRCSSWAPTTWSRRSTSTTSPPRTNLITSRQMAVLAALERHGHPRRHLQRREGRRGTWGAPLSGRVAQARPGHRTRTSSTRTSPWRTSDPRQDPGNNPAPSPEPTLEPEPTPEPTPEPSPEPQPTPEPEPEQPTLGKNVIAPMLDTATIVVGTLTGIRLDLTR